ncbi:MAG: hypothetical protein JWQ79_1995 [Mucilaginibacter sp.]|nr:hypothetical protein [Mucilaginibacter sp.]
MRANTFQQFRAEPVTEKLLPFTGRVLYQAGQVQKNPESFGSFLGLHIGPGECIHNKSCHTTCTSSTDVVGGSWPEVGFALPVTKDKP